MSKRSATGSMECSRSQRSRRSTRHPTRSRSISSKTRASPRSQLPVDTTIVCLCSGRGSSAKAVGLAALQPDQNKLYLAQYIDQTSFFNTCAVLTKFDALHVVISKTLIGKNVMSPLVKELKNSFPNSTLSGVGRMYFNDKEGLDTIRRVNMLPQRTAALEVELREKYYALASANALIKYVENTQPALAPVARSLLISFLPSSEGLCHIDAISVRELELVRSRSTGTSGANKFTLFDVINFTCTAPGERALRWRLLQPFTRQDDIEEQLNNVGELISNPDILENLRALLRKSTDLEKILAALHMASESHCDRTTAIASRVQNLLALKFNLNLLGSFETVLDALGDSDCIYLEAIHQFLLDGRFREISHEINRYLIPEATLSHGVLDSLNIRMQCVRPGISHTLDEYRRLYGELIRDAESACKEAAVEHQMPLRLTYNATRGFHLSLSRRGFSLKDLPASFLKLTTEQASYHFTTELLLQINERMEWLCAVIYDKTMVVLNPLLKTIEPSTESLYKVAEILSELDVACSLAVVATCSYGFVRPKFSEDATASGESRHPVYTRHWTPDDHEGFHCNPIFFTKHDNMIVLSGPNNSGKTVYMKQVVLLQILAQIGCHVPAKWAVFRPASSIISRTGHGDDLRSNCSTFKMEVLRIGQMIRHLEEDSLIIIDELGRGTSEEDGSALCFAVGNYLCNFRCFVIFSTHFELVMHLEKFFPSVSNYHMEATFCENGDLRYAHKLRVGVTPLNSYGVPVALQSGLAEEVCTRGAEVAEEIRSDMRPLRQLDESEALLKFRRQAAQLRGKLFFLSECQSKPVELTDDLYYEIKSLEDSIRKLEHLIEVGNHISEAFAPDRRPASKIPLQKSVRRAAMSVSRFLRSDPSRGQRTPDSHYLPGRRNRD